MPKQNCIKKEKDLKGGLVLTINCNGSNVGNGVGIGNGNLNGGGSGCGCDSGAGTTGGTGSTGTTGDAPVCISKCNLVCEQIFLEQSVEPRSISRVGQELTWTLKATNISGKRITRPLVVTSSYFGTVLLTSRGLDPGATVPLIYKSSVEAADLRTNPLTSTAFVSYGVSNGRLGGYDPAERVSNVVTTEVVVIIPDLDFFGTALVERTPENIGIGLGLKLENKGSLEITNFAANLANIFVGCEPQLQTPIGSPFVIIDKTLILRNATIGVGQKIEVAIKADNCPQCLGCCINSDKRQCSVNYEYQSEQGAVIFSSVKIPVQEL